MAAKILKRIFLSHITPQNYKPAILLYSSSPPSDQNPNLIPTIVSLLTHHRSKTRWAHLRSLLLTPTTRLTPTQISQIALHLKAKPHLALRFFHFTLSHPSLFSHDLSSFSTLAHLLSRARLKSAAHDVILVALHSSDSFNYPDPVLKFFEFLVRSYRECDSAPFVFDLLIMACLELGKIDGSFEIVRKLRSCGISPQLRTCNSLVSRVVEDRGSYEGYTAFKELFGLVEGEDERKVKGVARVRPNVHSFNALMEGFCKDGEMEMVEELWRVMKRFGCVASAYSYSILVSVFFKRRRVREVEELREEMRVKGIEPDVAVYDALISGFSEVEEIGKADEVVREMELKGIETTCVAFEHLVKGYCMVGDVDSALLVYKNSFRSEFLSKASVVDALVEKLSEKNRVSDGLDIMRAAMKDVMFCPGRKSYEFLAKGLCEEGRMEEALKLQAEMVSKGFRPDSKIYATFIEGYLKSGNEEMASMLRKEMSELVSAAAA